MPHTVRAPPETNGAGGAAGEGKSTGERDMAIRGQDVLTGGNAGEENRNVTEEPQGGRPRQVEWRQLM